jgi:hypothetical protein
MVLGRFSLVTWRWTIPRSQPLSEGWNVDLLTWLLIVFGFGFAICLKLLVKATGDLSPGSSFEATAFRETPAKAPSTVGLVAKAAASHESSPLLSGAR